MVLSATDSARVVALLEDGRSQAYVSRTLGIPRTTVRRVFHRYQETGGYTRRPGSGRPRSTSARDDHFILLNVLRNRRTTAVEARQRLLQVRNVNVSSRTVRRRLSEAGLQARRPAIGPELQPRHRTARLNFARNHINWSQQDWGNVLFSDESRFCLRAPDGRERVWRRKGERFIASTFSHRRSYGGGSITAWAGISMEGRTDIIFIEGSLTAERYIEEVLSEAVVPFAPFVGDQFLLMHDNARPHTARIVNDYLERCSIHCLEWPACSPDLNPIEHLWDELSRKIKSRPILPETLQELKVALVEEYENIPADYIQNLIKSMPRRMQAVINARGGNTPY